MKPWANPGAVFFALARFGPSLGRFAGPERVGAGCITLRFSGARPGAPGANIVWLLTFWRRLPASLCDQERGLATRIRTRLDHAQVGKGDF